MLGEGFEVADLGLGMVRVGGGSRVFVIVGEGEGEGEAGVVGAYVCVCGSVRAELFDWCVRAAVLYID